MYHRLISQVKILPNEVTQLMQMNNDAMPSTPFVLHVSELFHFNFELYQNKYGNTGNMTRAELCQKDTKSIFKIWNGMRQKKCIQLEFIQVFQTFILAEFIISQLYRSSQL